MIEGHYIALSGGVGGAKLALGLANILPPEALTIVANTGDDFEHLGLHISPDIDTLLYNLAGLANRTTGWGREDESWNFMDALRQLGGECWFQLGDKDLALHVERTQRLTNGETLSEVIAALAESLDIQHKIVPMSDDPVRTMVATPQGELSFQHYFVRDKCQPVVTGFRFDGIDRASPSPGFLAALERPDLKAVIICPSNPFVSIDPIFSLPGVASILHERSVPIVAVSPIVGGKAIKGPAAKMMAELDMPPTAFAIAQYYQGVIDGLVIDRQDHNLVDDIKKINIRAIVTQTVMKCDADKRDLAEQVLDFAEDIAASDVSARKVSA
ncbi:Lactyl (2) diphospho-(5')guanosine:7,8-didemethyl-8-hydroxy-5-deazariboflavin 2-phospho-L-lactate transferase [hydrothermal vent metagenome]|uniref:Lactyl (2) diphospho-(5')guanosine:7,8-didemethyl-8-hydroxy-5-deazariboflavin 2-phospho-L-lactate transferase n=1 Tax=hydrothermal vent metagenome TaxID=652676 RepID=A0A3B0SBN9_9ZZZZ